MEVPDQFEVTAFVAERHWRSYSILLRPQVVYGPLRIMTKTRRSHTTHHKNIQIFEDTDGDGVFDTKKLFIDKLTFASGLQSAWEASRRDATRAYFILMRMETISQMANIRYPRWLGNSRPSRNSEYFIWGPDGWMYGCRVFTRSNVGKPGTPDENVSLSMVAFGVFTLSVRNSRFLLRAYPTLGIDFNDMGQALLLLCDSAPFPHVQGGIYHKQSRRT